MTKHLKNLLAAKEAMPLPPLSELLERRCADDARDPLAGFRDIRHQKSGSEDEALKAEQRIATILNEQLTS